MDACLHYVMFHCVRFDSQHKNIAKSHIILHSHSTHSSHKHTQTHFHTRSSKNSIKSNRCHSSVWKVITEQATLLSRAQSAIQFARRKYYFYERRIPCSHACCRSQSKNNSVVCLFILLFALLFCISFSLFIAWNFPHRKYKVKVAWKWNEILPLVLLVLLANK